MNRPIVETPVNFVQWNRQLDRLVAQARSQIQHQKIRPQATQVNRPMNKQRSPVNQIFLPVNQIYMNLRRPIKKRKEPIKGILKSKNLKPNVTGQSNFSVGQSNSGKTIFSSFRANDNAGIMDVAEDENLLDDEKISHLKEQIMMWKYRT